jgi:hypothetical protein
VTDPSSPAIETIRHLIPTTEARLWDLDGVPAARREKLGCARIAFDVILRIEGTKRK